MNNIENGIKDVGDTIGELKEKLSDLQELADTKAAAIYETTSGEIASFSDGADDLPMKSCVVNIEPIQEGSGDPSPDNVRPISGRTGLSVVRCGKNLFYSSESNSYTLNGVTATFDASTQAITVSGTNTSGTAYVLLNIGQLNLPRNTPLCKPLPFDDVYYNLVYYTDIWRGVDNGGIIPDSATRITLQVGIYGGATTINRLLYPQIELGSTPSNYEPYKGNTYSVNWETEAGTVYGGTLDVVSGKLTVLGVKDTVTVVGGQLRSQFFYESSGQSVTVLGDNVRTSLNRISQTSNINTISSSYNVKMANLCPHYFSYAADTAHWYVNNQLYLYLPKADVGETFESYKTFLQDNPFEVYIPFATPTEIQLTPQEVRTLLGENNIWSDGGDMEVAYPADTKLYIDQKITEAIAAAMA